MALRCKLGMFGIPVNFPTDILCDNPSVVNNSSKIESVLNIKNCSIAYHALRWAPAASIAKVGKVHTGDNIAGVLTKTINSH